MHAKISVCTPSGILADVQRKSLEGQPNEILHSRRGWSSVSGLTFRSTAVAGQCESHVDWRYGVVGQA